MKIDLARLAEFFVREKKYRPPVSTVGAVIYTVLFSVAYTGWIEYQGASDGKCEQIMICTQS